MPVQLISNYKMSSDTRRELLLGCLLISFSKLCLEINKLEGETDFGVAITLANSECLGVGDMIPPSGTHSSQQKLIRLHDEKIFCQRSQTVKLLL